MEIKLKDNTSTNKNEFIKISCLTKKLANKTLGQLEKEGVFVFPENINNAKDITNDQMVLQSVNDCYKTTNIMGFLGYGKERLVIESRFSDNNYDFFFQYLLERILEFPNVLELNTDANHDSKLLNILMFLFPRYLESAMRKGIFKTYIHNQYNDSNVKGSIDVARHIRLNTPFIGKVSYKQREFSYDNYLMEIIRHTIEFIKTKPHGLELLNKVNNDVSIVVKATPNYKYCNRRKIIMENKIKTIQHAYFYDYRKLQRLCIMILQHEKQQIGSGMKEIHGILFDGAWLWEEYINSLIKDFFYHPMNKGGKGSQRLFHGNVGLIYPDFIGRNTYNRIIADAKYKPVYNIGNKDYLQVLAYMFRFNARKGFYFYPEKAQIEPITLLLNQGSTYENNVTSRNDVSVTKYGLHIPCNTKDYENFKRQIKNSEQALYSLFCTVN